jgi:hypothetical protein
MDQGGELIDALSQTLLGPQVSKQGDHIPQHEKGVTVPGVLTGLIQARLDLRKGRPGEWLEDEIEWCGTNLQHARNLAGIRESGFGSLDGEWKSLA